MTVSMNDEEVDMLQEKTQTILLVEAERSLRRLMTLGLQSHGMRVIEASSVEHITALQSQRPDVVLLDIDGETGSNYSLLSTLDTHPYFSTIPLIVLSWDCLLPGSKQNFHPRASLKCVAKPFDARTLHATIEQIHDAGKTSGPVSGQELLLAKRSVPSPPSIWPLIPAAGLVLSLIGLMTQIGLSALGLLVILVALLVWSLGGKPEPEPFAL